MARKPITIGAKEFKFQKDALAFFKKMLNSYRANRTIEEGDHEFLLALLERHPEAARKIGVGIKRFYKAPTEMGTSCFWVERTDGSKTDFSYITAVKAQGKSLYQEFADACRNAVRADLIKTKEEFFNQHGDEHGKVECEISGEKMAIYESHLDHKKPLTFQVIVNTFIAANNITISKGMLSTPQDAQFESEFSDQSTKRQFKEYHHRMAQLRIINPKANLSLGGSERITRSKRPVFIMENKVT
jgi:Protein of unknown function (DUF3223)